MNWTRVEDRPSRFGRPSGQVRPTPVRWLGLRNMRAYRTIVSLALLTSMPGFLLATPPAPKSNRNRPVRPPASKPGPGTVVSFPLRDLTVDVVERQGSPPLHGLVLHRNSRGDVVLAVEREWLAHNDPDQLRQLAENEVATTFRAWEELQQRLQAWHSQTGLSARLVSYLESEQKRASEAASTLTATGTQREPPQFVLLDLPIRQIQRIHTAPARNRSLALLGWRENLADVSTRPAADVDRELRALGFEPEAEQVNLSERLPLRLQSEREWQARKAILTFVHHQSLIYQGTSERLHRTGPDAPPVSTARLLAETVQSQLQQTLQELVEPGQTQRQAANNPIPANTLAACRREAVRLVLPAYRATSIQLEAETLKARLNSRLDVQLGPQEWLTIWHGSRSATPGIAQGQEARQRLREDPQVRALLRSLQGSGLAGDEAVNTALDLGLATQQSLAELDSQFQLFLGHYGVHSEGPPLFLPDPTAPGNSPANFHSP